MLGAGEATLRFPKNASLTLCRAATYAPFTCSLCTSRLFISTAGCCSFASWNSAAIVFSSTRYTFLPVSLYGTSVFTMRSSLLPPSPSPTYTSASSRASPMDAPPRT